MYRTFLPSSPLLISHVLLPAGAPPANLLQRRREKLPDDTTGIILSLVALVETLTALVPLLGVLLVRYGGCVALHSSLRGVLTPIPRQQSVEGDDATIESSH